MAPPRSPAGLIGETRRYVLDRLAIMTRVHGAWVRRAFIAGDLGSVPHCDCSRCGIPSPHAMVGGQLDAATLKARRASEVQS